MSRLSFVVPLLLLAGCSAAMNESISSLDAIKSAEGRLIRVSGTLLPSETAKKMPVALQLGDGSKVYLGTFEAGSDLDMTRLDPYYHRSVQISGTVFVSAIPARYQIVSRLNAPYLVDIKNIQVVEP